MITADLYEGSIIQKAYGGGDEGLISSEIIRVQLNSKLEKGIIDQPLYDKAIEQLDSLMKAGEGSKGGHVIGHTKSGKPVYKGKNQASSKEYKDFTSEDHADASHLHNQAYAEHSNKIGGPHSQYASAMAGHHGEARDNHRKASIETHQASLHPDEKKIIADQKKKKLDHHNRMADFHKTMLDHIKQYKENKQTGYGSQATQDGIQEIEHHHQKQFEHHDEQANAHVLDATIALSKEKGTLGQYRGPK